MIKTSTLKMRQRLFLLKIVACSLGIFGVFFVFTSESSMQEEAVEMNANMSMNANARQLPPPPKSTIRGRIIYSDTGSPVRRAGLMLIRAKGFGSGRESGGVTNERGEFEIKNVSEGRYFVSISTPGVLTPFSSLKNLSSRALSSDDLADMTKDFQEIVVDGMTDIDVTVAAKRGGAISGRIVYPDGDVAVGVRVEVLRKKDDRFNPLIPNLTDVFGAMFGGAGGMKTDDRGVFRIAGLPAGEYVVRVVENVSHTNNQNNRDEEMTMIMGFNPNSMVSTYFPNTLDVKKAETVKVELGQEAPEINITIVERNLHTLKGVVVNKATKQIVKGARLSIKNDDVDSIFNEMRNSGMGNQTDEQGRWTFKDLPAGKYTLTVQPPYVYEERTDEKTPQQPKSPKLSKLQKEIIVEDVREKPAEDLTLELNYGATISGTVSFDNQQDFNSSFNITATDEENKFSEGTSIYPGYSRDGKPQSKKIAEFKIEGIPEGKFFINVRREGGIGEKEDANFYVKSILLEGKEIGITALTTKEGETIKNVQIVLSKDAGKIKGKVSKADKSPVAGAKILIVPVDKQKWSNSNAQLSAATNGEGVFETSGAPGEYFVILQKEFSPLAADETKKTVVEQRREWLEKETANAEKITVKAKETTTVTLTSP